MKGTFVISCCLSLSLLTFGGRVSVSFPAERQRLPSVSETYLMGAVDAGRDELLFVNGVTTDVYRTGAFVTMVPVVAGTNVVTLVHGRERLVRSFFVQSPPRNTSSAERWEPIVADDDPRLGEEGAWRTTGELFANRVRSQPDAGDSLYFLPTGFVLRGAPLKDLPWVQVWLEGRRGYLPKSCVSVRPAVKLPPKNLIAPDPMIGFADHPP